MELLELESKDGIRTVTFNNQKKKNAINRKVYLALARVLNEAAKDETIKCLVITGKGDFFRWLDFVLFLINLSNLKCSFHFSCSSGNDLTQTIDTATAIHQPLIEMVQAFIRFPKLLVAIVNGPAIGIAATVIALCDVIYVSETSYFYTPFTNLGKFSEICRLDISWN